MAKQTKSFRLPEESLKELDSLTKLFRESESELVQRAISYLYKHQEEAAKQDLEDRLRLVMKKE